MKAILYTRVSPDRPLQSARAVQMEALRAWAQEHGMEVIREATEIDTTPSSPRKEGL